MLLLKRERHRWMKRKKRERRARDTRRDRQGCFGGEGSDSSFMGRAWRFTRPAQRNWLADVRTAPQMEIRGCKTHVPSEDTFTSHGTSDPILIIFLPCGTGRMWPTNVSAGICGLNRLMFDAGLRHTHWPLLWPLGCDGSRFWYLDSGEGVWGERAPVSWMRRRTSSEEESGKCYGTLTACDRDECHAVCVCVNVCNNNYYIPP